MQGASAGSPPFRIKENAMAFPDMVRDGGAKPLPDGPIEDGPDALSIDLFGVDGVCDMDCGQVVDVAGSD